MKKILYLFSLLLLLASCSDENSGSSPSGGENVAAHFSLHPSQMNGAATRSTTTLTPEIESKIVHLWVFQFESSADGSGLLLSKISLPVSDPSDIDITLKANASNKTSKLYFVANMEKATFPAAGAMTESAFKALATDKIDSESGFLLQNTTAGNYIPMFGEIKDPLTVLGGGALDKVLQVNMVRMLARVDLVYSVSAPNFTLQRIRVCNVPTTMEYYRATDALSVPLYGTEQVPAIKDAATDLLNFPYEGTVNSSVTSTTLTFYLPPNHRGVGTNTDAAHDEKLKTGISNATYFELTGLSTAGTTGNVFTYKFYPGQDGYNDYNLDRNTYYTLTASVSGTALSDLRINALPKSNCYIVAPGGSVDIPISRANEGQAILGSVPISNIASPDCTASVYWQTAAGLVTVDAGSASCSGGFFTVKAPSASEGNAVVCIKRGTTILWSWHIWVTSYTPNTTNQTYANGITFMDRNLGATTNVLPDVSQWTAAGQVKTDVGSFGLLYQWGRKDPFPGSASITTNATFTAATGAGTNPTIYNGAGSAYSVATAPTCTGATATGLVSSIANPFTFYTGSDWYSSSGTQNNALWGNYYKTVYDPCPVGWRVPGKDSWVGLDTKKAGTSTSNLWDDFSSFPWYGSDHTKFIGRTISGAAASYPAAGNRNGSDGSFSGVGTYGSCWSSAVNGTGGYGMYFYSGAVNPAYSYVYRAAGFSVRCVKE
jgi:uncharacterized protein (TIGR02145 family)